MLRALPKVLLEPRDNIIIELLNELNYGDNVQVHNNSQNSAYRMIYKLNHKAPDLCLLTISNQLEAFFSVKVMLLNKRSGRCQLMKSFSEVWDQSDALRVEFYRRFKSLDSSSRPEAIMDIIWDLGYKYKYKLPTNFVPGYAKKLYEQFLGSMTSSSTGPIVVLDPCAGYGDRLIAFSSYAASVSPSSTFKYLAFDPNTKLRTGYVKILQDYFNINVAGEEDRYLKFDNSCEIFSEPFEHGAPKHIPDESVDFIFTSPPYFGYEIYNQETNPIYKDWIQEFYIPLIKECFRCLRSGCFLALHLQDTCAGTISTFLQDIPAVHAPGMEFMYKIGLESVYHKDVIRDVWVFRKTKAF